MIVLHNHLNPIDRRQPSWPWWRRLNRMTCSIRPSRASLAWDGGRRAMPRAVRKAAEALEWAPARPWKRDDLSREVDCSIACLTRQFTEAMGVPPMAYLRRIRAERAA